MSENFNILRIYTALYVPLLFLTGLLIYTGHELPGRQYPQLTLLLACGFFLAALLKLYAVVRDDDIVYQAAYIVATVVMSSWTFTSLVYALFGIAPFGRAVVFGYVLAQNAVMLPHLLQERRSTIALNGAQDVAAASKKTYEDRNGHS